MTLRLVDSCNLYSDQHFPDSFGWNGPDVVNEAVEDMCLSIYQRRIHDAMVDAGFDWSPEYGEVYAEWDEDAKRYSDFDDDEDVVQCARDTFKTAADQAWDDIIFMDEDTVRKTYDAIC